MAERTFGNVFSKTFSKGWVLDLGYARLKIPSEIRSQMVVQISKIFVWGAYNSPWKIAKLAYDLLVKLHVLQPNPHSILLWTPRGYSGEYIESDIPTWTSRVPNQARSTANITGCWKNRHRLINTMEMGLRKQADFSQNHARYLENERICQIRLTRG